MFGYLNLFYFTFTYVTLIFKLSIGIAVHFLCFILHHACFKHATILQDGVRFLRDSLL